MATVREMIKAAQSAEGDELWIAIRSQHPEVLDNASLNRHLTEDMALYIAKNKNTSSETLGFLAGDVRFKDVYRVRLAIAKNPKCPQRVALSLIKYLRIFDLADITRDKRIPSMFRQKVELTIAEKLPALPEGIKSALTKRACAELVMRIMDMSEKKVIDSCLESPILTEEHLTKLIRRARTGPVVIRLIAEHQKWSVRYPIRYALLRNNHTPMEYAGRFIEDMKTIDLQELYDDTKVPDIMKPFMFRELKDRGKPLEAPEEIVYELKGDEDEEMNESGEF